MTTSRDFRLQLWRGPQHRPTMPLGGIRPRAGHNPWQPDLLKAPKANSQRSDFTSARMSAVATLHQRMDFAAAWVRREPSSSADCRKQILRPVAFPKSVGWAEQLVEDASAARVEFSIAEAHQSSDWVVSPTCNPSRISWDSPHVFLPC